MSPWRALAVLALLAQMPARCQEAAAPTRFVLPIGLRTIVKPEPDDPFVAVCVLIKAGALEEGQQPGVGELTARSVFGGNLNETATTEARAVYALGGNLEIRWAPDYTLISCVTTRDRLDDAMYTISEAIKAPAFDLPTVMKAQANVIADRERAPTRTFQAAFTALREGMDSYGPYRAPFGGGPASLRRLRIDMLQSFHRRWYTPGNTVISIVGNVTTDQVRRTVERHFVRGYDRPDTRAPWADEAVEPSAGARTVLRLPTNTTVVMVGFGAPGLLSPDYPAAAVLNALLGGGKASRLFRSVRDGAGIGYVVSSYLPPLAHPSVLLAYVEYDGGKPRADGTAADDVAVEKMIADTARSVVTSPPTAQELERAKRFVVGGHALAHQRARDRAFHLGWYELLGLGFGFDVSFPDSVSKVTAEDVRRVAERYLARHAVVVVRPAAVEAGTPAGQ